MFNNYNLSDDDVIEIINRYENLINKYSRITKDDPIDEDLRAEIIKKIYTALTKNKKNKKFFMNLFHSKKITAFLINRKGFKPFRYGKSTLKIE